MKRVSIIFIFFFIGKLFPCFCQQIVYSERDNKWYALYHRNILKLGSMRSFSDMRELSVWLTIGDKIIADSSRMYCYGGGAGSFFQRMDVIDTSNIPRDSIIWKRGIYSVYIDSIPEASEIKTMTLQNGMPAYAIIENNGKNYLMRYSAGKFQLQPLLVKLDPYIRVILYIGIFVDVILALIIAIIIYRRHKEKVQILEMIRSHREDNALQTKSEKPLGVEEDDLLGFDSLEDCIVRVMRNVELELPLTIVISGTWGSGKSSMMNRIKEKLEGDKQMRKRFLTTWFNAWHVQGETSLLSSFLLNILDCYERRYNYGFSFFRMKLAYMRFLQLPMLKKFAFGFSIAIVLPFVLLILMKVLGIGDASPSVIYEYCNGLKHIFSFEGKGGFGFHTLTPIGGGVLIIFSILFLNRQFIPAGLSAFFELLPKSNFLLEAEKMEPGSRSKFKREFWEIMEAGKKGARLVVFVDDLDRIAGDKILELIEAINFISDVASKPSGTRLTAPNMIFVLGMYTAEVTKNVGAQLNKINGTSLPAEVLGSLYVEKMVQLIVPVPFDHENREKLRKLYENE